VNVSTGQRALHREEEQTQSNQTHAPVRASEAVQ
jgi:hypothetical protein